MHDDQERRGRDLGDSGEIAQRVVADFAVHRGNHGLGRLRTDEQRVTVGRRFGDVIGADDAAGTGPVLDQHGMADAIGEPLRQDARGEIDTAARGERDDDANRLRRIPLRPDVRGCQRCQHK
jgi:hypothetical protein